MASNSVIPPFQIFNDIDGSPLESGYIYCGTAGLNPEASPKNVFWDVELTVPASQPIRTIGGYPSRSGTPAMFYTDGNYSLTVRNKNSSLIYSALNRTFEVDASDLSNYLISSVDTIADMILLDVTLYSTINVRGYYAPNDGGGGIFNYDATQSAVNNGGTIINGWVRQESESISLKAFGAVGDGVADDTLNIQKLLDVGFTEINGGDGNTYKITAPLIIKSKTTLDLSKSSIVGSQTGDLLPLLFIRSDNVTIKNGFFGNGTVKSKCIIIGDPADDTIIHENITIKDNVFNILDLTGQQAIISLLGIIKNVTIENNVFTMTTPTAGACVYLQLGTSGSVPTTILNLKITNNKSINVPGLFENYSTATTSVVSITENFISGASNQALSTYHIFEATVANNTFRDCPSRIYIWSNTSFTDNTIENCGDGRQCIIIENSTGERFTGNKITNALGYGIILDGQVQSTISDNAITGSSLGGILINPAENYGGSVVGTVIQNNSIYGNYEHGIEVNISGIVRNLSILDNYISANGAGNLTQMAGIYLQCATALSSNELIITNNIIRNSDIVLGIVGNTQWGIKFEAQSFGFTDAYISKNTFKTVFSIYDARTAGTDGVKFVDNIVQDFTNRLVRSYADTCGNYSVTDYVQDKNSRLQNGTPVGVLTPLYQGEEVYDRAANKWYKGVGPFNGPWTSADWAALT